VFDNNNTADEEPYNPGERVRFRALVTTEEGGEAVQTLAGRIRTRHDGGIHDDLETIASYQIIVDEDTEDEETYEMVDYSQIIDE
jgi:hypothetical protein